MPYLKNMGINTARLAFAFPWDPTASGALILDYTKMDEVIDFLAQNGIKSILDNHSNQTLMLEENGMLNHQLAQSWQELAEHYKDNGNVVAYELYNEPLHNGSTNMNTAEAYNQLTRAVRQNDPKHIVIWQTPAHYIPIFEKIQSLMLPNVVYTTHFWWTNNTAQIQQYGAEELSRMVLDPLVYCRNKYSIPIWIGEFGGPGGGAHAYTSTDPQWEICEQLLYRAEEQGIGWNLWMGLTAITNTIPKNYQPLFPLQVCNPNLTRLQWVYPSTPSPIAYLVSQNCLDSATSSTFGLYHNGDFVVLNAQGRPATIVDVLVSRVVNGTEQTVSSQNITISDQNVIITNNEGTPVHPGDWNTIVRIIQYA